MIEWLIDRILILSFLVLFYCLVDEVNMIRKYLRRINKKLGGVTK